MVNRKRKEETGLKNLEMAVPEALRAEMVMEDKWVRERRCLERECRDGCPPC